MNTNPLIDTQRLESVVQLTAGHAAAAAGLAMFELGDRLGLYRALAGAGPLTAAELAAETGCNERLISEWLFSQTAAGYLSYDDTDETFGLGPEETVVFRSRRFASVLRRRGPSDPLVLPRRRPSRGGVQG